MMSGDFFYRNKIPVAILGATGCVGQKFIQLLENHPWFQVTALCASENSCGKPYKDVVNWMLPTPVPSFIEEMIVQPCLPGMDCQLVFSALNSEAARTIELKFAEAGYLVLSNSSAYRMDPHVPLVVGEVNPDHLELARQQLTPGKIITNPNCSVIGLSIALKPLLDRFGIKSAQIVTLQAISGGGFPGVASLDICDNIIPFIPDEEEKLEREPPKVLGQLKDQKIEPADFIISAACNRVPVTDGHLACVSVKLNKNAVQQELIQAWGEFIGEPQQMQLPTAPSKVIYYLEKSSYPQPKLHRSLDKEMAVSLGRLRVCPVLDFKFVVLSHNTMRGAAGSALLNAELLVKKGWVYWS
ncbi:MAG: aspartate-semialdehyde dehydrogenase [Candidatus Protochlamydia sp.]|nr:aspartate-semialdehyde dehydrogenase [Candidatus Protochlamydia sp.]